MRYGVFSDPHGNLEGLFACLERLKKEGVDAYINCGDIIGYGADSELCVRTVAALPNTISVLGNHDAVFITPELELLFNQDARHALAYSKAQLTEDSIQFLKSLPASYQGDGFTVVHGTPSDPIKEYFSSCAQFQANYPLWTGQVCFVGHMHLPFYIQGDKYTSEVVINRQADFTLKLQPHLRYIINPGSCGKPRDNDPRASFGILDTEQKTFRFLRQEYDFSVTQKKMADAGLPPFLVGSISLGL